MTKSTRKSAKRVISAKKNKGKRKGQTKAVEYVGNLLELHKLQGILLTKLGREV